MLPNENIVMDIPMSRTIEYMNSYTDPVRYINQNVRGRYYSKVILRSSTPNFNGPRVAPLYPLPYTRVESDERSWVGNQRTTSGVPGKSGYSYNYTTGVIDSGSCVSFVANSFSPAQISESDDLCNQKLLAKVKGSTVNMGVVWGERQKTIDLVTNTITNVAGAYGDLRRGDFMGAARHLGVAGRKRANSRFNTNYAKNKAKALGSGWLELQYGWKPLLTDVFGAVEELANQQASPHIMQVTSRQVREEDIRFSSLSTVSPSYRATVLITGRRSLIIRKGVTFFRKPGAPQDLPRLGITNPAVVAWELVPFSFVVDWFLPIGNWLETLDATLGIEFLSGYTSVLQSCYMNGFRTQSGVSGLTENLGYQRSLTRYVDMRRTILNSFPNVGIPHFKNPVSTGHMWNAMALLSQQFGRR